MTARRKRMGPPGAGARKYGELWNEQEITVLLAAAPRETQDYRPEAPFVRELADLLGRTPGSISLHLGNISALIWPGHGKKNVAKEIVRVFDKYRGKDDLLKREAARLRLEYFGDLSSPRLEKELTEQEADRLEAELKKRFPEARLPTGSVILYRRPGSTWLGVLAPVHLALIYFEETRALLRIALEVLGDAVKKTPGVDLVLHGHQVDLAEREIHRLAPRFHPHELKEADRVTLALRLPSLMSLKRWKRTVNRLELYTSIDRTAEQNRIRAYFRIDVHELCKDCLLMLLDALEDGLATGKL